MRDRRDSQRVTSRRHVTAGATAVIGCEVGAHGTGRRHSLHSSVRATEAAAQTGAAPSTTFTQHLSDNKFEPLHALCLLSSNLDFYSRHRQRFE